MTASAITPPALDAARLSAVERARESYLWWADVARWADSRKSTFADNVWREVDAASLSYDLAVAEASIERVRASVAWG